MEPLEPPIIQGRVPPHDLQAEAACLSAALLDGEALATVLTMLESEMFYSDAHKVIYEAASSLFRAGTAVDAVSVASWLRARELIQRAGGAKYIGDIVDATPSIANCATHCVIVREEWQRRRLIAECQRIAAEGYAFKPQKRGRDDDGLSLGHREWVDDAERRLFGVTSLATRSEPEQVAVSVRPLQQALAEVAAGREPTAGLIRRTNTGIREYDRTFPGWGDGNLVVIGAVPGMGKTSLFTRVARNMCVSTGEGALLFSIEMPKDEQASRVLSQESGVSLTKILHGGKQRPFSSVELGLLASASATIHEMDFEIDHTPAMTLMELTAKARRAAARRRARGKRLALVGVDYLQLLRVGGLRRQSSREEEVATISRELKRLAGDLKCPVVAMSALNRQLGQRTNKRPVLDDLRESGAIGADADQVIFIYREFYYTRRNQDRMHAELIQAKFRNGPTGSVDVAFWPWCVRFCDRGDYALNVDDE